MQNFEFQTFFCLNTSKLSYTPQRHLNEVRFCTQCSFRIHVIFIVQLNYFFVHFLYAIQR